MTSGTSTQRSAQGESVIGGPIPIPVEAIRTMFVRIVFPLAFLLLLFQFLGCTGESKSASKLDRLKINGVHLGMTLPEVEEKLGEADHVYEEHRTYDFKTVTIVFDEEGLAKSVSANSEFGEVVFDFEGTEYRSFPNSTVLSPTLGEPQGGHSPFGGQSYVYTQADLSLELSAGGQGQWSITLRTRNKA